MLAWIANLGWGASVAVSEQVRILRRFMNFWHISSSGD